MGSPWVFDSHAWSKIKQYLGLGEASSSSGSEIHLLPKAKKQKLFNHKQISDHIYEIFKEPIAQSSKRPGMPFADIFFFHGLQLGNSNHPHISTWLSGDGMDLWLNWLLEEFQEKGQDVRIFTISYDASPERRADRGRLDMYCTCENLMGELIRNRKSARDEVGCPIILVGHCLGGLVLKEVCVAVAHRSAIEEKDERWKYLRFLNNVKGIVCYASPHHGSELPDCSGECERGSLFETFKPLDAATARGNEHFRLLRKNRNWKSLGVGESHEVSLGNFRGLIVPEASSRCDVDSYFTAAADHFNVCRPESNRSTAYTMLRELVDDVIKENRKISKTVRKRTTDRHQLMLGFEEDTRYVRLEATEKRVREALAKPAEPRVVLLHGGPGRGKSTLAQDLALQVESGKERRLKSSHETPEDKSSPPPPDSHIAGEGLQSDPIDLSVAFDMAVYLKCGPDVRLLALQTELRKRLGWDRRELRKERIAKDDADSDFNLRKSLRSLLQNQKVLLILDDVCDAKVLQSMISLCGNHVKCLVTSQDAKLCSHVNCGSLEAILMETVSLTDAKKILASHILGLDVKIQDRQIPEHIERLADTLIERVDGNLLAIACLATAVDTQSFTEEHVWQEVAHTWSDYLEEESTALIHGLGHQHGSYWVAMKMCFERLIKGAKKLLILVSVCIGPSVPAEVVQYFYELLKPKGLSENFLKAKGQLEEKQLIQLEHFDIDQPYWSIHSLLKEFIVQKCETDGLDVLETLRQSCRSGSDEGRTANSEGEENIKLVLLGLYLDHLDLFIKMLDEMDIETDDSDKLLDRRYVVEPLISLLVSKNAAFDTDLQYHVQQVFLHYIQHGQILENDAIILLKAPKYCLSMLEVLQKLAEELAGDSSTADNPIGEALFAVEVAGDSSTADNPIGNELCAQEVAEDSSTADNPIGDELCVRELAEDSSTTDNPTGIELELMATLLELLSNRDSRYQKGLVSNICLAFFHLHEQGYRRPEDPENLISSRVLEELTDALCTDNDHELQRTALSGLVRIAIDSEIARRLCDTPHTLGEIIECLFSFDRPMLQINAAEALDNLAMTSGQKGCHAITGSRRFLDGLSNFFTALYDPVSQMCDRDLQQQITELLRDLANHGTREVVEVISAVPGVFRVLVDALAMHAYPDLQKESAFTLEILARKGGNSVSLKISDTQGALHNLADSLCNEDNPGLQKGATAALARLADKGGHELSKRICNTQGLLEKLVRSLSKDCRPTLQKLTMLALSHLAEQSNHELREKMSEVPGALQALVDALARDAYPDIQVKSATALEILAGKGGHAMDLIDSGTDGALRNVVGSFTKADNHDFQKQAAWALGTLALGGGPELSKQICNTSGLLDNLISSLSRDDDPVFQEHAARTLSCFAQEGCLEVLEKASNAPGALQALVDALVKHAYPDLQAQSANFLAILVRNGGNAVAVKIGETQGVLQHLAESLTNDDNPELQEGAAWALASLADEGGHELCKRICNTQGLLEELVSSLSKDGKPGLQENVTAALANLAEKSKRKVAEDIVNVPGALQAFVDALAPYAYPALQAESANALEILARKGGKKVALRISGTDGALENLIDSLTKNDDHDTQMQAARALGSLANEGGPEMSKRICSTIGFLDNLVSLLRKDDNPCLQEQATGTLAAFAHGGYLEVEEISNVPGALQMLGDALAKPAYPGLQAKSASVLEVLARKGGNRVAVNISETRGALQNLADSLTKDDNPELQNEAAGALACLADEGGHELSKRICKTRGLMRSVVNLLSKEGNPDLQETAAMALANLAYQGGHSVREEMKDDLTTCEALAQVVVMAENVHSGCTSFCGCFAMRALSLIDPIRGRELPIKSTFAYGERGYGELILGMNEVALKDFDKAWRSQHLHGDDTLMAKILRHRAAAKARLGKLQGALKDLDRCVSLIRSNAHLQERGVLKRMMGDLPGALTDFDEVLQSLPDDYENLKHRGYVKFVMQDENGARADAKRALEVKPPRVDFTEYGHDSLGASSVEYLDFKLR